MRSGFLKQLVWNLVGATFGRLTWLGWFQVVLTSVFSLYVAKHYFDLGPTGEQVEQVDKGVKGLTVMTAGLSSQLSQAAEAHRADQAARDQALTGRLDGIARTLDTIHAAPGAPRGAGGVPPAPRPEPAPGPGAKRGPVFAPAVSDPVVSGPAHRRLWRGQLPAAPGGKPASVAFAVTATEPRLEALLLDELRTALGGYNIGMAPVAGAPPETIIDFAATYGSAGPRAGCHIVKQLVLRTRYTGGRAGDGPETSEDECLDRAATADSVQDVLARRIARRAASELVSRPLARL